MKHGGINSGSKRGASGSAGAREAALRADVRAAKRAEAADKRQAKRDAKKKKKAEKIGTELAALSPRELVAAARQYEENKQAKRGLFKFGAGLALFLACFGVFFVNLQNNVDASQRSAVINQISSRSYALSPVVSDGVLPIEQLEQAEQPAAENVNPLDADLGGGDPGAVELIREEQPVQEAVPAEQYTEPAGQYTAPAAVAYSAPKKNYSYSSSSASRSNYSGRSTRSGAVKAQETPQPPVEQPAEQPAAEAPAQSEAPAAVESAPVQEESNSGGSDYSEGSSGGSSGDASGGGSEESIDNGMVLY